MGKGVNRGRAASTSVCSIRKFVVLKTVERAGREKKGIRRSNKTGGLSWEGGIGLGTLLTFERSGGRVRRRMGTYLCSPIPPRK